MHKPQGWVEERRKVLHQRYVVISWTSDNYASMLWLSYICSCTQIQVCLRSVMFIGIMAWHAIHVGAMKSSSRPAPPLTD